MAIESRIKLIRLNSKDNLIDILSLCIKDRWETLKHPRQLRIYFFNGKDMLYSVRLESIRLLPDEFLAKLCGYCQISVGNYITPMSLASGM